MKLLDFTCLMLFTLMTTIGVSQIDTSIVVIYPNPCDSVATQRILIEDHQLLKVTILDLKGTAVYELKLQNFNESLRFSTLLDSLASGIYFSVTEIDGTSVVQKLLFQGEDSLLRLNFDVQVTPRIAESNQVLLYPNPTLHQELKIEMKTESDVVNCLIYNNNGMLIYEKTVLAQNNYILHSVPTEEWVSGQYHVKITSNTGETTSTFIKVRN